MPTLRCRTPAACATKIGAGPVTVRDVYQVMPFDNFIALVTLTGTELRETISHGVNPRGCIQVAGVRYTFDPEAENGEYLIDLTLADGTPIDPDAEYVVAVNNFMTQGGDGYTMLRDAEKIDNTTILIRECHDRRLPRSRPPRDSLSSPGSTVVSRRPLRARQSHSAWLPQPHIRRLTLG